ncbi:hypothetical protein [Afifella marina]|uniref:Uncharacterized protein n=1 Tax=Afifella marina DSM 2698 TaxID=1120955 RepID=A0A1G5NL41_AFIMA|nr:hypothetical protein [Afifella marina]SCZ37320.1 hypothetical protein SAMN03080610_02150 [Afifella marina DSM 2698]
MVNIGNINNETGGQISINDLRHISLPPELVDKILQLNAADKDIQSRIGEVKAVSREVLKKVFVKAGAEKLISVLDDIFL